MQLTKLLLLLVLSLFSVLSSFSRFLFRMKPVWGFRTSTIPSASFLWSSVSGAHCSYLDIYISWKIRLGMRFIWKANFKPAYKSKLSIFWSENWNLLFSFFFYFLQELSNPVLFGHSRCYFKKVEISESRFCIKLQFKYFNSLE